MTASKASFPTRRIAGFAIAASVALSAPVAANAAGAGAPEVAQPRVMVPHVPAPAPHGGVAGCWSAQRLIYGPYAFSFCSNGRYGSYQVRGGGLFCNGTVNVNRGPRNTVTVQLSRSQCNGWTDWSADHLVCRVTGGGRTRNNQGLANDSRYAAEVATPHVATPRVPVPHFPVPGQRLDCTYVPVVSGYHPIGLAMTRN